MPEDTDGLTDISPELVAILPMNRLLFAFIAIIYIHCSCTEKKYVSGSGLHVIFSEDTIHFDTVFTTIGTVTREVRIINPYEGWLKINHIYLGNGDQSSFRLNIDGTPGNESWNIELPPNDSIFIFIDAIIDPTNENSPVAITDSIIVQIDNSICDINLVAWGQDIHLINAAQIHTETWQNDKPYVVYNSMLVDTGYQLTIEKGTRVLFHRGSTMYIAGKLVVEGTVDEPVIFKSDRFEEIYSDIPGQWAGLYFINSSTENKIDHAIIQNAVSGVHLGNLNSVDSPPDLKISNSLIQHMSVTGISSLGAMISANNCVISHCGFYCLFLAAGGEYDFSHCTISNQWDYALRLSPSVAISDYIEYDKVVYSGLLLSAEFNNSVIYGPLASEVGLFPLVETNVLNCSFTSNLMKIDADNTIWSNYNLTNCIIGVDPDFINSADYDLRPDTLSPLLNVADIAIADNFPYDIRSYSRFEDSGPDIGAYERQIGEISEK